VAGELRRRGHQGASVELSESGAQRLVAATRATDNDVAQQSAEGIVDGWVWSDAVMTFEPTEGRRFKVSVDEPLQAAVAELNTDPRPTVVAVLSVVTVHPHGDAQTARRSYSLVSISPQVAQLTLDES
jgi:hypothetical protein